MTNQDNKRSSNVYSGFNEEVKNENVAKFEASATPEYKEYRQKWEEYPEKLIVADFPLHLDIGITSRCNLKCPMCTRTQEIAAGTWKIPIKDLDFDLFKKAVDEGSQNGLCAINFDNFGEPLLNEKIFEMIRYCKDKGIMDVFFHSNATLLTEEKAIKLVESGLDKLIISFDSPYKKKYEKIRVGGTFEKTVENIKNLARIKKEMNSIRPLTRINCIRFPNTTRKEMEDTIKLLAPIVDSVSFIDYVNPTKSKKGKFSDNYKSKFICPQIITRLTVWEDGLISPCCMDYDRTLGLGNIKENSLKSAWESKKLKAIRDKHIAGKFFEIPACKDCHFALENDAILNKK